MKFTLKDRGTGLRIGVVRMEIQSYKELIESRYLGLSSDRHQFLVAGR